VSLEDWNQTRRGLDRHDASRRESAPEEQHTDTDMRAEVKDASRVLFGRNVVFAINEDLAEGLQGRVVRHDEVDLAAWRVELKLDRSPPSAATEQHSCEYHSSPEASRSDSRCKCDSQPKPGGEVAAKSSVKPGHRRTASSSHRSGSH